MEMLDASLAFALTLAALSTVVTIILEALHRLLRVRKWNLILTMKKLTAEIAGDGVIDGRSCWDFVVKVLNNETHPNTQKLLTSNELEKTKPVKQGILPWCWNNLFTLSFGDLQLPGKRHDNAGSTVISWLKKLTQLPRRFLMGEKPARSSLPEGDYLRAIDSLKRSHATRAIFDKVSVEHILRRFVELPAVKNQLDLSRVKVEAELDKISRKYEEFASSVTADFKRRSRMWSIFIGVILAFSVNIDATRIFDAYLKDKSLTANVIKHYEKLEENVADEQKKDNEGIKEAEVQLQSLSVLGVPIGNSYFPHCMFLNKADEITVATQNSPDAQKGIASKTIAWIYNWYENTSLTNGSDSGARKNNGMVDHCLAGQITNSWWSSIIGWLMTAGITGILIGLGAPFWFDVARRIAEVRSMFNGKQDNEQRMAGKDVNGDRQDRKELVKNVIEDAVADKKLEDAAKTQT